MSVDFVTHLVDGGITEAVSVELRTGQFRVLVEEFEFRDATKRILSEEFEHKYVILLPNGNRSKIAVADRLVSSRVSESPLLIAPNHGVFGKLVKGVPTRLIMMKNEKYRLWFEKTCIRIPVVLIPYFVQNAERMNSFYTNAFDFFRCRHHSFEVVYGKVVKGKTTLLLDAEYNSVTRMGQDEVLPATVESQWSPPPHYEDKPVDQALLGIFKKRLGEYFMAPRRPEPTENMSSNIIGEFVTNDSVEAILLNNVNQRSCFVPTKWCEVIRPKAIVYPFPKWGSLKSDLTPRVVSMMDVSYEAYLRVKYGLREYESLYSDSHFVPATTLVLRGFRYSFDVKNCDVQLVQYLGKIPEYADLIPFTFHEGVFYTASAFPSGSLLTSALTRVFIEAVLERNAVEPNDVKISGDGFICKYPAIIRGVEVRAERDYLISGFSYADGVRRYTRGNRLTDIAYVRRGKISGLLLWLVRYRAYKALACENLPHNTTYVQCSFRLGRIYQGLYIHQMSDGGVARMLSTIPLDVDNTVKRAFGMQCIKTHYQNPMVNPLAVLYPNAFHKIPEQVYL